MTLNEGLEKEKVELVAQTQRKKKPNGSGSVFKRKSRPGSKLWVAQTAHKDEEGKLVRKLHYHYTEAEAEADLALMKSSIADKFHPGRVLHERFLEPRGISQYRLAKAMGVNQMRISEIIRGKRSMTAETAILLSEQLDTDPMFWLNLQARYDLAKAQAKSEEDS